MGKTFFFSYQKALITSQARRTHADLQKLKQLPNTESGPARSAAPGAHNLKIWGPSSTAVVCASRQYLCQCPELWVHTNLTVPLQKRKRIGGIAIAGCKNICAPLTMQPDILTNSGNGHLVCVCFCSQDTVSATCILRGVYVICISS